jgi:uncharacterized membrane protein YfcA
MSTAVLLSIVAGTCAGGFVSGIAGFAFGLVALSFWTWLIDPHLLAPMAVFGSFVAQTLSLGAVRRSMQWRRVMPFLLGGFVGVPIGVALLQHVDMTTFRITVGAILIAYCSFMLVASNVEPIAAGGRLADGCVGLIGGTMGGLAGLTGPAPTMWCTIRGWDKDTQRSIFQTFNLAMQTIALITYGVNGTLTAPVLKAFGVMLPAVAVPAWVGARLYKRIDDQLFRRIVLVLLLLSGVVLLASTAFGRHR